MGNTFNPLYSHTRFRVKLLPPSWPADFVIISAYATTAQQWPEADNTDADQRLSEEFARRGPWRWRITGYSPATGHAEPGWAVELPIKEGRKIGRQFQQDAIFVVRADALGYASCSGDADLTWFGAFRERVGVAPP